MEKDKRRHKKKTKGEMTRAKLRVNEKTNGEVMKWVSG